jgi:ketosteroid isomerase-like protein
MNEHPNSVLVTRCYAAFAAGELDRLRELMADDVVWHEPGRSSIAGDHKGRGGVVEFLEQLNTLSRGTLSVELIDVMVNAERAVAIQRLRAQVGERALDVIDALDFEIHNGRITEISVYQQDAYVFDEFWSAAATPD